MSERITVVCDGPHCIRSIPKGLFKRNGWRRRGAVDYCPRCASGKCSGEIGPTDRSCSCILDLHHEGRCQCEHTIGSGDE